MNIFVVATEEDSTIKQIESIAKRYGLVKLALPNTVHRVKLIVGICHVTTYFDQIAYFTVLRNNDKMFVTKKENFVLLRQCLENRIHLENHLNFEMRTSVSLPLISKISALVSTGNGPATPSISNYVETENKNLL